MYLPTPYKIDYDTKKYPFREIVSNMLEINNNRLEDLHLLENYGLLSREQDQKTKWHKKYYDKFQTEFLSTYLKLVKEIKEDLNSSPYALKATVWTDEGSNEGYYGLSIKQSDIKPKLISSTGKKVFKRENETNALLATWDTIAKAAEAENMSTAKMSRCVKNKNIINDYYYSVI